MKKAKQNNEFNQTINLSNDSKILQEMEQKTMKDYEKIKFKQENSKFYPKKED